MTQPATDGLLALQNKRAAAKRSTPSRIKPSQNPTTLPPYEAPTVAGGRGNTDQIAPPETHAESAPAAEDKPSRAALKPATATETEPASAPRVKGTTTYLDEPHKAYLRQVAIEGLSRSTKIDVSSSAVIRFALNRVMADMTAAQVYEAIAAKPVDAKIPGRKRR